MKEKDLLKVSLVFSLLGILILFHITYNTEIKLYEIISLNEEHIDKLVRVKGIVESFSETPGLYLINLRDDTGKITVVVFKDEELQFQKNMALEVIGNVIQYKDGLEFISKQIVS